MAGLLAARVLADHFAEVSVVEIDAKPEQPADRKGTPQGRHVHSLLPRGAHVLETLFPGIRAALALDGAAEVDLLNEVASYVGGWSTRVPGRELRGPFMSRALLEWHVDRRVRALPNVRLCSGVRARGLRLDSDSRRITGVLLSEREGKDAEHLDGDLVVDAMGRGSRLSSWLVELGLSPAPVTEISIATVYASRIIERPDPSPPWKMLLLFPAAGGRHGGAVFPLEGNRLLVTLVGMAGAEPPHESDQAYLDFARALDVPDLYDLLARARPLGPIVRHRFTSNQRRHYERCPELPRRLLVLGDAACSFNPRFGQGMTVAALEAEALQPLLGQGDLDTLGARFHQRIAPIIDQCWQATTAEDLRYPEAIGARPLSLRVLQWYVARIMRRLQTDPVVKETFLRVSFLLDPPAALLRPSFAARVLLPARRNAG